MDGLTDIEIRKNVVYLRSKQKLYIFLLKFCIFLKKNCILYSIIVGFYNLWMIAFSFFLIISIPDIWNCKKPIFQKKFMKNFLKL